MSTAAKVSPRIDQAEPNRLFYLRVFGLSDAIWEPMIPLLQSIVLQARSLVSVSSSSTFPLVVIEHINWMYLGYKLPAGRVRFVWTRDEEAAGSFDTELDGTDRFRMSVPEMAERVAQWMTQSLPYVSLYQMLVTRIIRRMKHGSPIPIDRLLAKPDLIYDLLGKDETGRGFSHAEVDRAMHGATLTVQQLLCRCWLLALTKVSRHKKWSKRLAVMSLAQKGLEIDSRDEQLRHWLDNPEEIDGLAVQEIGKNITGEEVSTILEGGVCPERVLTAFLLNATDGTKAQAASDINCPPNLLICLANDSSASVRRCVLESPSITPVIIAMVAQFSDEECAMIIAKHELTPPEVTAQFAFHSDLATRYYAAKSLAGLTRLIRLTDWVRDNLGFSSSRYMTLINDILAKGEDPSWLVPAGRFLKKVYFDNTTMFYKTLVMMRSSTASAFLSNINSDDSLGVENIADFLRQLKPTVRIRMICKILKQRDRILINRLLDLIKTSRPETLEAINSSTSQKSHVSLEKIVVSLEKTAEQKQRRQLLNNPVYAKSLTNPPWFNRLLHRNLQGDENYTLMGATSAYQIKIWSRLLRNCLRTYSIESLLARQCHDLFLGIFDQKKLKFLVCMKKNGEISEAKGFGNCAVDESLLDGLRSLVKEEINQIVPL